MRKGCCSINIVTNKSYFFPFQNGLLQKSQLWGLTVTSSVESLCKPTDVGRLEIRTAISHQMWLWQPSSGLCFPSPGSTVTFHVLSQGTTQTPWRLRLAQLEPPRGQRAPLRFGAIPPTPGLSGDIHMSPLPAQLSHTLQTFHAWCCNQQLPKPILQSRQGGCSSACINWRAIQSARESDFPQQSCVNITPKHSQTCWEVSSEPNNIFNSLIAF